MTERAKIKEWILKVLLSTDGLPMPDDALNGAVKAGFASTPTNSDIAVARKELEDGFYISGSKDEVTGSVTWTLTTKGQHKAKQLGA